MSLLIQKGTLWEVQGMRPGISRWGWRPPGRRKNTSSKSTQCNSSWCKVAPTSRTRRNESHATMSAWLWDQITSTLPHGWANTVILLILKDVHAPLHAAIWHPLGLLQHGVTLHWVSLALAPRWPPSPHTVQGGDKAAQAQTSQVSHLQHFGPKNNFKVGKTLVGV